ncbi:MAG: hypothetical protein ACTSU5_18440 [Promethearchaeota archaeon]
MSTDALNKVLEEINSRGKFRASLFATGDGLVLASARNPQINERIVAAMGSLLADAAEKAKEEIDLSDMLSVKILYRDGLLLCRQVYIETTPFLLAVLADPPASSEFDAYFEQLLDWAVENSQASLKSLASL